MCSLAEGSDGGQFVPTREILLVNLPCVCKCQLHPCLPACPNFHLIQPSFSSFRQRPVATRMAHPGSLPPNGRAPQQQMVDPFADWESMFESGELDASLKNLDLSKPPPPLPGQQAAVPPRVILQEQEEGRSEYQPPEPKMTIMKRPDSSSSTSNAKAAAELKQKKSQQKSLKQREQEYAEARQRILGSLGAAEEAKQQQQQQSPQQQHMRVVAAPPVRMAGRGGMRGAPNHGPRYPESVSVAPILTSNPIPSMPPSRPVAPYSAQRQFRVPPPHIVSVGGPTSPLEIATRAPRGPPPEGGRGFPPSRR